MVKYLANSLSINMFDFSKVIVKIEKINANEFCDEIRDSNNLINGIGHESTVNLVNSLCKTNYKVNRIMLKINRGDELYIINILERLQEGKILNIEELENLMKNGKIGFYKITL